ncbi:right-handed parallel beta-helix repeat-containing protein [Kordia sp. YSTF-M3]|uniref:Right-handed parallel beta-helix repeat-containing protein n=1 Tax=Kordia aestuariivivens TaxID=2759037 RepID=A0ABR7QF69_9FLAO|nr:right-handed parallel beta-helix repeat-containing protein [Kordia aestuariivivens]MBC8757192.1 right-handed parallel beta-helix repeat-containing protein [Kordia aestuariivivens]
MIYDIMDYGVEADGTTDDIAAINTLITNTSNSGGGTLIFPSGKVILISAPIQLKSDVCLITSGAKTTLKAIDIDDDETDPEPQPNGTPDTDMASIFSTYGGASGTRKNIKISGFDFVLSPSGNGNPLDDFTLDFINQAIFINDAENITIENCAFNNLSAFAGIYVQETKNITIKNCVFKNSSGGVNFHGTNENVKIDSNTFEYLSTHGIHIQGSGDITNNKYCSNVWITKNRIVIGAEDVHGIYLTCGDTQFAGSSSHHENVVVADNVITGPGSLSNASDGTADLFSLKDIVRLKCYGNTARNSGDLGFAIERCHFGVVSNNTADQNNSCGISIFGSSHMSVTGNVCAHNEQNHDYDPLTNSGGLGSAPYGGIRVEFDSVHVLLSGNHFFGAGFEAGNTEQGQTYGIVVKEANVEDITDINLRTRSPYNIKIGINHYADNKNGDIYNEIESTIISDLNATVAPTP